MKDVLNVIPFIKKYKFVFLIIAAGVFLLMAPSFFSSRSNSGSTSATTTDSEEYFSVTTLQTQLADALSNIDGAGNVTVVLTVKSGTERVLAQDTQTKTSGDSTEESAQTVVISSNNNSQDTVLLQQIYPTFQGALVICSGANDATVKLALTRAVSSLTGLGSDKITICKGK
jgi:stage III sporulation protein AG